MSNFDETMLKRLTKLEREVERLKVKERPAGGSGVTDHGALTGLSDDDHPQYLLTTGKAADSDKLDGIDSTGFATAGHDHDSDYLGITAKASDSDKLDNIDSTGFVQTSGNQTVGGIKTFTSIPALPATNPTTANQAVRKGFADATYLGISAKAADSDKLDGLDSTDFALASGLGAWQDWTPTVTWAGTAPTTTTITLARYCKVGKLVAFNVYLNITRGSGTSTAATITPPVAIGSVGVAIGRTTLHGSLEPIVCNISSSSNSISPQLITAMSSDGYMVIGGFYEVA